jgi:hypothetical protein
MLKVRRTGICIKAGIRGFKSSGDIEIIRIMMGNMYCPEHTGMMIYIMMNIIGKILGQEYGNPIPDSNFPIKNTMIVKNIITSMEKPFIMISRL